MIFRNIFLTCEIKSMVGLVEHAHGSLFFGNGIFILLCNLIFFSKKIFFSLKLLTSLFLPPSAPSSFIEPVKKKRGHPRTSTGPSRNSHPGGVGRSNSHPRGVGKATVVKRKC